MIDLDNCRVELEPLISGEMSKFHLPADIYTNREVQEEE
jgi:hypothetical protein